ncbi:hypothetical protein [Metaclostridioides mangenotii]|uniref:hypothetical protein n=1 Tax=Metaclostridioides mangenotii TaxID=1540 RepID=UPI000489F6C4|nr:hypothetical protein [Clostridioides mangenotii]
MIYKLNTRFLDVKDEVNLPGIKSSMKPFRIKFSDILRLETGNWSNDPAFELNHKNKVFTITSEYCEGQIGSADKPFTNGYFKNSINVTSDRNKKENIHYLEDIDSKLTLNDCYDYIKNVYKPATYNLIDSNSSTKKRYNCTR